jgi:predicted transcriptional regulator
MADTNEVREQLHRFFALTEQFKVQLAALDDTVPRVQVQVREVDDPSTGIDATDIEAVAFIVLMQASKSAQEDLKMMMEQLKNITAQKNKVRAALKESAERGLDLLSVSAALSAVTTKAFIDRAVEEMDDLDSPNGELAALRLQMMMDRLSKLMSTLSNILKKMSDTASQITQNMK